MFLTHCPSIRSVGTRNLTINLSEDSQPPGGTCNVGIPVNYAVTIAADKIFFVQYTANCSSYIIDRMEYIRLIN
jgi:hypothetical protein